MNIFVLSEDPVEAAIFQCDKHVVKMVVELAQMLSGTFWLQGIEAPYKKTHGNHPCSIWVRTSRENFAWALRHGRALGEEYQRRYGRVHATTKVIEWLEREEGRLVLPSAGLTKFPVTVAENSICRADRRWERSSPVERYRLFYIHDKCYFAKWKLGNVPEWYLLG